jgi:hypothetical protein
MVKVQAKKELVLKVLSGYNSSSTLDMSGAGNLTYTGGKIHALGGGWWQITGYRSDAKDRDRVVKSLQNLKKGLPRETFSDILNLGMPKTRK